MRLLNRQITETHRRLDQLTAQLASTQESEPGPVTQESEPGPVTQEGEPGQAKQHDASPCILAGSGKDRHASQKPGMLCNGGITPRCAV